MIDFFEVDVQLFGFGLYEFAVSEWVTMNVFVASPAKHGHVAFVVFQFGEASHWQYVMDFHVFEAANPATHGASEIVRFQRCFLESFCLFSCLSVNSQIPFRPLFESAVGNGDVEHIVYDG